VLLVVHEFHGFIEKVLRLGIEIRGGAGSRGGGSFFLLGMKDWGGKEEEWDERFHGRMSKGRGVEGYGLFFRFGFTADEGDAVGFEAVVCGGGLAGFGVSAEDGAELADLAGFVAGG
jgi:hypothetical protein